MAYFEVNNPDNLKKELIDGSNPDSGLILNLLEKIKPKKAKYSSDKLYLISSDKEFLAKEIVKLISEDLESTIEEFDFDGFEIQYFFLLYNPFIKMASFSCELKNPNGGAVIYDIVRVYQYRNEYYLLRI